MTLLIFFFSLAVIVSFMCSLMESVLMSITPAYIKVAEQEKRRYAKILAQL